MLERARFVLKCLHFAAGVVVTFLVVVAYALIVAVWLGQFD